MLLLVGASLALAFLGPFGTTPAMPAAVRIQYFLATVMAIGAIAWLSALLLGRFGSSLGTWQRALAVAAMSALPGAFVVEACLAVWAPGSLEDVTLGSLTLQVFAVNLCISAAAVRLVPMAHTLDRTDRPRAAAALPEGLSASLPLPLREAEVWAVSAEDHYLRVHTSLGQALIHMGLNDAEGLLGAASGMRVHRSHWVSFAAVERAARDRGRLHLQVRGNLTIPVSRRRHAAVVATIAAHPGLPRQARAQQAERPSG